MRRIILFDGKCHFCLKSVQFILKRDRKNIFYFASLQSTIGQNLQAKHKISRKSPRLILSEGKNYYTKSSAVFHICKHLSGGWKLLYSLLLIPKPVRDFFYDIVAKQRHRLVTSDKHCFLPTKEEREKFLSYKK